jgi:hypothetical protein
MVIHLSPVNDLTRSKAFTPGHREILKVSRLFSVISVRSSERSERVVKRIFGFFHQPLIFTGDKCITK